MGFTLLQLDSDRGIGSDLCPLQTTSASAGAGNSVIGDTVTIKNESNIETGFWKRMILLRSSNTKPAAERCLRRSHVLSRLSTSPRAERTAISPAVLPS